MKTGGRALVVAVFLAAVWGGHGRESPVRAGWELLEGCRRVESGHNDGDSVVVRHGGGTHVFRLYFVDSLERNPRSRGRLIEQAGEFGIPEGRVGEARALGEEAKRFTREQTDGDVRVWTKWELVTPNSSNPSIRAFIEGRDGDLAELLVRNGLAIIRTGHQAHSAHPDGRSASQVMAELQSVEREAKAERRGGWGVAAKSDGAAARSNPPNDTRKERVRPSPGSGSSPATAHAGIMHAADTQALLAIVGEHAVVAGRIGRVGALPDERIVFLNFEGSVRGDFCGIIRRDDLGPLRAVHGARFPYDLEGRDVELSGLVTEYRCIPQIEVTSPGQVRLP